LTKNKKLYEQFIFLKIYADNLKLDSESNDYDLM